MAYDPEDLERQRAQLRALWGAADNWEDLTEAARRGVKIYVACYWVAATWFMGMWIIGGALFLHGDRSAGITLVNVGAYIPALFIGAIGTACLYRLKGDLKVTTNVFPVVGPRRLGPLFLALGVWIAIQTIRASWAS